MEAAEVILVEKDACTFRGVGEVMEFFAVVAIGDEERLARHFLRPPGIENLLLFFGSDVDDEVAATIAARVTREFLENREMDGGIHACGGLEKRVWREYSGRGWFLGCLDRFAG